MAERDVSYSVVLQSSVQALLVELGEMPRGGDRAYVYYFFDVVSLQQADKLVEGMVGMPDGKYSGFRGQRSFSRASMGITST